MEKADRREREHAPQVQPDALLVVGAEPAELQLEADAEQECEQAVRLAVDGEAGQLVESSVERSEPLRRQGAEAPQAISDEHAEHGEAADDVELEDSFARRDRPLPFAHGPSPPHPARPDPSNRIT